MFLNTFYQSQVLNKDRYLPIINFKIFQFIFIEEYLYLYIYFTITLFFKTRLNKIIQYFIYEGMFTIDFVPTYTFWLVSYRQLQLYSCDYFIWPSPERTAAIRGYPNPKFRAIKQLKFNCIQYKFNKDGQFRAQTGCAFRFGLKPKWGL